MAKAAKKNTKSNRKAQTQEAAPATKKGKAKAEKPARTGMTTREAAAAVSKIVGKEITPVRLRRILRTDDFMNDAGYTRYDLDDATVNRLAEAIQAGADGRTKKAGRKGKKNAQVEEAASEEVQEELDELESDEDEGEELELDADESDEDDDEDSDEDEDEDDEDDEDE